MTENVENMIFEVLKKIQVDITLLRAETSHRFDAVEEQLVRVEDLGRKYRREVAGMLVMAKSVAGTFTEELAAVEERVRALEAASA